MRASQAFDFLLREELPDRSQWDRTYSHISDFWHLVERRKEIKDEILVYGDYDSGTVDICKACHREIDTSMHSGERISCQHCGTPLQVRYRSDK